MLAPTDTATTSENAFASAEAIRPAGVGSLPPVNLPKGYLKYQLIECQNHNNLLDKILISAIKWNELGEHQLLKNKNSQLVVRTSQIGKMKQRGDVLKAMTEPWPAKTKINVEMNSENAALSAAGCVASSFVPTAILDIAILSLSLSLTDAAGDRLIAFSGTDNG